MYFMKRYKSIQQTATVQCLVDSDTYVEQLWFHTEALVLPSARLEVKGEPCLSAWARVVPLSFFSLRSTRGSLRAAVERCMRVVSPWQRTGQRETASLGVAAELVLHTGPKNQEIKCQTVSTGLSLKKNVTGMLPFTMNPA